jgi:predicted Zn-dependent protease with MMP-like domain
MIMSIPAERMKRLHVLAREAVAWLPEKRREHGHMSNLLDGLANETVSVFPVNFAVLVAITVIFIFDRRRQHVFDCNLAMLSFDV